MTTTHDQKPRGGRMPRNARRAQLLESALEVFVAQGYHAAAMDDIAERAGVSKPVLYQHFPGKLELYLALLDQSCDTIIEASKDALASTDDNKQRVAATMHVFYDYVASAQGAFRLVFESDLTNEPAVRERVDRVTRECAEAIAEVIARGHRAARRAVPAAGGLPGGHGPGQRAVLAGHRARPRPRRTRLRSSQGWPGAASGATPAATSRPEHGRARLTHATPEQ